jgi:type IV pilus assembly protein PilY1
VVGCDEQDGWFIRLDQNSEEKVLAPATVFNKGAYYTTFSPDTSVSIDVCKSGNEGTARIYAVHWRTGEAILNFDTSNDSLSTTNARAKDSQGNILFRSDRVLTIGSGIPSQLNVIIMDKGIFGLVGVGGSIVSPKVNKGGEGEPTYWRELFF